MPLVVQSPRAEEPAVEADFSVENQGSIFLVALHTDAARVWISEHVTGETSYWGGRLVVEHLYIVGLVTGMLGDGLTCGSP